eukprot:6201730-Pleurochrysis_carterae.AAC.1
MVHGLVNFNASLRPVIPEQIWYDVRNSHSLDLSRLWKTANSRRLRASLRATHVAATVGHGRSEANAKATMPRCCLDSHGDHQHQARKAAVTRGAQH